MTQPSPWGLFAQGGLLLLVVIVILCAVIVFAVIRARKKGKTGPQGEVSLNPKITPGEFREVQDSENTPGTDGKKRWVIGTGLYRCVCYRRHPMYGPSVDFTVMPEAVGEIDLAETMLPVSGALYVIRETSDGLLEAYNEPRQKQIVSDETPEHAWILVHWASARRFWTARTKWTQNIGNWFVIGLGAATFIIVLVTIGG